MSLFPSSLLQCCLLSSLASLVYSIHFFPEQKIVRFLNWFTNESQLEQGNLNFPDVLYKASEMLGFLCKSPVPAAIHLVREHHIHLCRNENDAITSCPHPDGLFTLNLEPFEAGSYYVTSYSNANDDGKDEPSGGFCSLGVIFPVNIVDGKDPRHHSSTTLGGFGNETDEDVRRLNEMKEELGLAEVNDVHRHFVKSHKLEGFDDDLVDDGPIQYPNLEKIDEESAMMVSTTSPSIHPAYPILGIFISLFIICAVFIIGISIYKRNIALNTTTVAYTNLTNEGDDIALRDLNPV